MREPLRLVYMNEDLLGGIIYHLDGDVFTRFKKIDGILYELKNGELGSQVILEGQRVCVSLEGM